MQELNELRGVARQHGFSSRMEDAHQMPDIMDAVRAVMEQRGSEPSIRVRDAVDNFMRQRMAGRYTNFDVRRRSDSGSGSGSQSVPLPPPVSSSCFFLLQIRQEVALTVVASHL